MLLDHLEPEHHAAESHEMINENSMDMNDQNPDLE